MSTIRERFDAITPIAWIYIFMVLWTVVFIGLTVGYVTYDVAQTQHVWCRVIVTLNNAPAPSSKAPGVSGGAKQYDLTLAKEFRDLKESLGC